MATPVPVVSESTSPRAVVSLPPSKRRFPLPRNDWVDHDPRLVDEVVLHRRVYEGAAAVDQDLPTGLLLQPGHVLRDVALDQRRVVPLGPFQSRRNQDGGRPFIPSAKPASSVMDGQTAAKP